MDMPPDDVKITVGRQLAELRESLGLSQEELSRRIGISMSGVSTIERGLHAIHRRMRVSWERSLELKSGTITRAYRDGSPIEPAGERSEPSRERPLDYDQWEPWAQEMWDAAKRHGFTDEAAWRAIESVRIQLELDRRRPAG